MIFEPEKPASNPIAGLYPLAKLLMLLLYAAASLILGTITVGSAKLPLLSAATLPLLPLLAWATGVLRPFAKAAAKLIPLALFIVMLQAFFIRSPDILWSRKIWLVTVNIYSQGLRTGLTIAFSILHVGGAFVWFFACTKNKALIQAAIQSGLPYRAGYILLSALQMVGVFQSRAAAITEAQQARGVEVSGNIVIRLKALISIIIPAVISSIISLEERALSLHSKAFTLDCRKTSLYTVSPNGNETVVVTIAALYLAASVVARVFTV